MFISYYDYDIDFMFSIQSTKDILYIENFGKNMIIKKLLGLR